MRFFSPRYRRGTSIIAALIFAAVLGGIALSLNAVHPQNQRSITAAADATAGSTAPTPANGAGATNNVGYTASCAQIIQAAASVGGPSDFSPITDSKENLKDSCNAVIRKTGDAFVQAVGNQSYDVWRHNPNVYQCVGKSGTLKDNGNGTFTETMHADENVPAGKCSTEICDASGKCGSAQLTSGVTGGTPSGSPLSGFPPLGSEGAGGSGSPSVSPDQAGQNWCGNGAGNPPTCDTCPNNTSMQNGICQLSGGFSNPQSCSTPGSNPATCIPNGTQNVPDLCANVTCASGKVCDQLSGQCVDGLTNPPTPQARPCTGQNGNTIACPTGINTGNQVNNPSGPCPTGQSVDANGNCALVTYKTEVTPGGVTPAPSSGQSGSGGTSGLGSLFNGFMRGATFGGNPTTIGGNPTGQQQCSVIASLFGCQNASVSCQISISPNPPQQGMPASLTWTTSGNVGYAQISGVGTVGPSGTYTVYPQAGAQYTLQIQDQYGNQNSCSTQANVIPRTGCTGNSSCQSAQTPYGVGTNGQACG
ncbi:MAG TPA: hypothetical protein VMU25_02440, partial [Candidatus Paceibacterota bacterium]|nr:hypothetical protein [Candidatus Paceibacterota bacterium]